MNKNFFERPSVHLAQLHVMDVNGFFSSFNQAQKKKRKKNFKIHRIENQKKRSFMQQ